MTLPLIALKQSTVWGRKGGLGEDIYFPLSLSSVSSPFPLLSPLDVVAASVKQPQGPVDGRPALC